MYYHYCTIGNDLEVVHTPLLNGYTTVHFEKPDELYCFKTLDCVIPGYTVAECIGFTKEEMEYLIDFCKHNAHLLLKYTAEGGIENA